MGKNRDDDEEMRDDSDEEIRDDEDEQKQRLINEEYAMWKKEAPFLYDLLIIHALEWPSLTVEWLPGREEPAGKDYSLQKLVLGTQTSEIETNFLMLAQVRLPLEDDESVADGESVIDRGFGCSDGKNKVQLIQQIIHEGEVHRARYMPQNPSIIATKNFGSQVFVFDCSKHPSKPQSNAGCIPEIRLKGHTAEGYGLSWSHLKPGHLLSGSEDSQICLWDVNATPDMNSLEATQTLKVREGAVEDVAWHMRHDYLFGSAGDDHYLLLWDLRSPTLDKPVESVLAHKKAVNCLAFNPFNENIVATGSTDKTVRLFDLRNLKSCLHSMDWHREEVFQVCWNPKNETILASCCFGRRVMVWDLSRIDAEQTPKEAEEGPSELLFVHGGHTSKVSDLSWNPDEEWLMASVSDDNLLQIWQMAEQICHDDDDLPPPEGSTEAL